VSDSPDLAIGAPFSPDLSPEMRWQEGEREEGGRREGGCTEYYEGGRNKYGVIRMRREEVVRSTTNKEYS